MNVLYESYNQRTIQLLKRLNIPNVYYDDHTFYGVYDGQRLALEYCSMEILNDMQQKILERKPYLMKYQQLMNLDGFRFLNELYTLDFLMCIDSNTPKDTYIERCLIRPFIVLSLEEQLTRFFFMNIEYSLILREKFKRNLG